MNSTMAAAFLNGAGVAPGQLRAVVLSVAIGAIFVVAAWIVGQIAQALGNGEIEKSEAIKGCITLTIVLSIVIYLVVASRTIIWPLIEQVWMRSVPRFHGLHGCFALQR
jgi:integrating conjugative element protein (TIGR03758 family)